MALQDKHSETLQFLIEASQPLLDYCVRGADVVVDPFGAALQAHPAFVQFVQAGRCEDKQQQHVFLITQDFLYGLTELFHKSCACEETHDADTARTQAIQRIKFFADRMITIFDMRTSQDFIFAADVPDAVVEWYANAIQALATKQLSLEAALHELQAYKSTVDATVYIKIEFFMRYFSLLVA
jgi:hypothetical protein